MIFFQDEVQARIPSPLHLDKYQVPRFLLNVLSKLEFQAVKYFLILKETLI